MLPLVALMLVASASAQLVVDSNGGVCPTVGGDGWHQPGICTEACDDCEAKGKLCCSNGCGHECMDPVHSLPPQPIDDPTYKYECPIATGIGACVIACHSDADCNKKSNEKCCSTGCGRLCTKAQLPKKSGRCPPSPPIGGCVVMCTSHYQCPGEHLCCPNGCGQVCKAPVKE